MPCLPVLVSTLAVCATRSAPAQTVERPCCDFFGYSVANVGDADGDGVPDHAISCPARGNVSDCERVWMFSGATGRPLWKIESIESEPRYGRAVRAAGDVDGDGAGDVLVSTGTRSIDVRSGRDGSKLAAVVPSYDSWDYAFGFVGADDVDHDGRADFAVGSLLYSGRTFEPVRALAVPIESTSRAVRVSKLGDLDGDGSMELGFACARDRSGWVSVVSSRTGACLSFVDQWRFGAVAQATLGHEVVGHQVVQRRDATWGGAIHPAGDADGDGRGDLVVTSTMFGSEFSTAWIVTWPDFSPIQSVAVRSVARPSVIGVGDVDGDGCADLAFDSTATSFARQVTLHLGTSREQRSRDMTLGADDGGFGLYEIKSLEPAGDVDGDGCDDLLVAVLCTDDPGPPGCVVVLSSRSGATIRTYSTNAALESYGCVR